MSESIRPKVFSIPAGVSFVDVLAEGLWQRALRNPLKLAEMTVLLPNRRGCRSLQEAFLRRTLPGRTMGGSEHSATLLPRLMPLGDLDEEDIAVLGRGILGEAANLPPAIPGLRRQMLLARLIMKARSPGRGHPSMRLDQAAQLAAELARLLDQVETERLDLSQLDQLVPEDFATHWQVTIDFLDILRRNWPEILQAEGVLDPAERRNQLIDLQRRLWEAEPPQTPVIAAGSTGSIPASAELMATIARLPQGMVVLPGLDRHPSDEDWEVIERDPTHPQFGLAQLLKRIGVTRRDVSEFQASGLAEPLPSPETGEGGVGVNLPSMQPGSAIHPRLRVISAAMLPAECTDAWPRLAASFEGTVNDPDLQRIDCQNQQEEAALIALHLRRFVEEHDVGRAALVTPDRTLARRVAGELKRWNIAIDDSAGQPLAQLPPATFLLSLAKAASSDWAPVETLALLKHPLAAGGEPSGRLFATARLLERTILRGPRPAPGWAGICQALEATRSEFLKNWAARMAERFAPMSDWADSQPPAARLRQLLEIAESLAATDVESGAERLWRGEAGEALAEFVNQAWDGFSTLEPVDAWDFEGLLGQLLRSIDVRPRYGRHPRLFIWGPLEARLQQADLVILGSLNEGTWPAESAIDPWLNRPMRKSFGLPALERKIGLSAHDFQQAMGAPRVVLTRSLRVDGAPTVPSRWLLRLDAFRRCLKLPELADSLSPERSWAALLDRPAKVQACARPAPKPGAALRPQQLSVTRIETWRRDPYAIYARYILGLKPLDPLDQDPGVADMGVAVHGALDQFLRKFPNAWPTDPLRELLDLGEKSFGELLERPAVWAFWWPRFQRIAAWFVEVERQRRKGVAQSFTEIEAHLDLTDLQLPFVLTAKADRIDRLKDGSIAIIDYKTGQVPTAGEVHLGYAPQLPLEGAMALSGVFEGVAGNNVSELSYWRLTGSGEGGEIKPIRAGEKNRQIADFNTLSESARAGLIRLLRHYDQDEASYPAVPDPIYAPRHNDYEHLERILEWSAGEGREE